MLSLCFLLLASVKNHSFHIPCTREVKGMKAYTYMYTVLRKIDKKQKLHV